MAAEQNILQWAGNFAQGLAGQRPVFARGVEIGYWTDKTALCLGAINIKPQYMHIPKEEWVTKDDLWRDVPVLQYCAAAGLKPPSISEGEYQRLREQASPLTAALQPGGTASNVLAPVAELTGALKTYGKFVLAGGLGLAALMLLLRRR